jgi:hypothetical protein
MGDFYFTTDLSYGYFEWHRIFIEKNRSIFAKLVYRIVDQNDDEVVGEITPSSLNRTNSASSSNQPNQSKYYDWEVEHEYYKVSVFRSKTHSQFKARLHNDRDFAIVEWDYSDDEPQLYMLRELPVIGVINLSEPLNYLLVFITLFFCEMNLEQRQNRQDSS